jgi:hypothetical protein
MLRYHPETKGVKLCVLHRDVLRRIRERIVSAQALRAESAVVVRAKSKDQPRLNYSA